METNLFLFNMGARRKNSAEEDQWRSNLPDDVLMEILCRLPIKTLISLKSVCKLWLNLISADTHFADLHHERAPTELLLRSSKKLHLGNLQFHNSSVSDFKHTLLFNLPNLKLLPDPVLANSCNGFVCFSNRSVSGKLMDAVICNPVTGEFITVPSPEFHNIEASHHSYGLGFSGKENRYKLLRVVYTWNMVDPVTSVWWPSKAFAGICTLEKGSLWRNLGDCPISYKYRCFLQLVLLEGKLHFHYFDVRKNDYIDCFDIDSEQFGKVPLPPSFDYDSSYCSITDQVKLMGELGSCLSISQYAISSCFEVWVMKKYGVVDSWTKMFSVKTGVSGCFFELRSPLMNLGNGEILMRAAHNRLVLCNPDLNCARRLELGGFSFHQVIAYNPTLLLLKDALAGYEA